MAKPIAGGGVKHQMVNQLARMTRGGIAASWVPSSGEAISRGL